MEKELTKEIKENNTKTESLPKIRPCCACPETRKLRDNCIMNNGEDNCIKFIEDHKNCLKELGFHV